MTTSGLKPAPRTRASVRGSSNRIDVQSDQPSARLQLCEHRTRMAAEPERAIDGDVPGVGASSERFRPP